ncbi:NCS2 family permease [Oceanobacillus profundus]|uniref:NCS2 family permease n=1 Tax=Oceanobacillus profundus TaxID=372463 RepID=A0A417YLF2_9BACI|nr:NCS2 family permease [Oceanobacillus profundus]MBR3118535.1 NCS2 family permease [Oceanobacillus sp.]PAE29334.1 guanine permease [Paenibacillus sp. 7884-2]MCM3399347.1 NCS2 family permease [Oceanobacillus profundus]MDO6450297.1 NCS2 family permease [Oceanobacillus profundus]RHW34309.1 NCS2 family permease [Oceanobacillus profundus]
MDKGFKLKQNNTDIRTEVVAGTTTFLTMAYIVVVNPAILSSVGIPFEQVFMATVIAAIVGTLIMGIFANYPIAIAPGMGLNAYFASIVATQGLSYQVVFGTVFLAGILFIILSLTKLRETLIGAIPPSLKYGITSGIGLFIAFVGLRNSGIVVANPETIVGLGDLHDPMIVLTLVGLLITLILFVMKIKGALFIGMLATAIIAYFTGQLTVTGVLSAPPAPVFFDMDIGGVFSNGLYTVVFAFLLVTLFDTTGTMIGVAEQAGFMKDGKMPRAKQALLADATATTVGSMFGTSPSTAYIESTSGVAAGGRTGLTSIVVAILFALSIFFTPIISVIAGLPAITSPVLIIVGCFMMEGLAKVNWKAFDEAFPAFAVILTMPFTSSIATGIAIGFITYPILKLVSGKGKEVHWILYVFGVIFLIQMAFFPTH